MRITDEHKLILIADFLKIIRDNGGQLEDMLQWIKINDFISDLDEFIKKSNTILEPKGITITDVFAQNVTRILEEPVDDATLQNLLADPQTTLANIESNLNLKHHLRQLILTYDEATQLIATFFEHINHNSFILHQNRFSQCASRCIIKQFKDERKQQRFKEALSVDEQAVMTDIYDSFLSIRIENIFSTQAYSNNLLKFSTYLSQHPYRFPLALLDQISMYLNNEGLTSACHLRLGDCLKALGCTDEDLDTSNDCYGYQLLINQSGLDDHWMNEQDYKLSYFQSFIHTSLSQDEKAKLFHLFESKEPKLQDNILKLIFDKHDLYLEAFSKLSNPKQMALLTFLIQHGKPWSVLFRNTSIEQQQAMTHYLASELQGPFLQKFIVELSEEEHKIMLWGMCDEQTSIDILTNLFNCCGYVFAPEAIQQIIHAKKDLMREDGFIKKHCLKHDLSDSQMQEILNNIIFGKKSSRRLNRLKPLLRNPSQSSRLSMGARVRSIFHKTNVRPYSLEEQVAAVSHTSTSSNHK